jgi:hypothetical protein
MTPIASFSALALPQEYAATAANFHLIVPLSIACLAIVIAVPVSAHRSRLHIPGYVGLAFLSLILGLVCGRISGLHGIAATTTGVFLSFVFFLLISLTVGSVLALFFYRDPPQQDL